MQTMCVNVVSRYSCTCFGVLGDSSYDLYDILFHWHTSKRRTYFFYFFVFVLEAIHPHPCWRGFEGVRLSTVPRLVREVAF